VVSLCRGGNPRDENRWICGLSAYPTVDASPGNERPRQDYRMARGNPTGAHDTNQNPRPGGYPAPDYP